MKLSELLADDNEYVSHIHELEEALDDAIIELESIWGGNPPNNARYEKLIPQLRAALEFLA